MRRKLLRVLCVLLLVGVACFAVLEGVVIAQSFGRVKGAPGAMVILGAQLREDGPSLFLQRRLETALDYLEVHPDTLVVVSGGQGDNEPDTEANGMEKFLRQKGFEGVILKEDQSRNTAQNLKNSRAVLEAAGYDVRQGVVLVSNDFHLARCALLARRFGYEPSTLSAPSDHLGYKLYNFIREPFGLVKSFLFDH